MVIAGGVVALSVAWPKVSHAMTRCPHGRRRSGDRCAECALVREADRLREEALRRQVDLEKVERDRRQAEVIAELGRRAGAWVKERECLERMDPFEFESFVLEIYRRLGWTVRGTRRTGDGGVDGFLTRAGLTLVLQCKRQKGNVGEPVVRDLLGSTIHAAASGGLLVTTSDFTDAAKRWAMGKPLTLVDRTQLMALVREAFPYDAPPGFLRGSQWVAGGGIHCPACGQTIRIDKYRSGIAAKCVGCAWRHWMPVRNEGGTRPRRRRRWR